MSFLAGIVFIVGVLTGLTGVGGILVIPALGAFAGLSVQSSMATAMFSFVFVGVAATWMQQRRRAIDWAAHPASCPGGRDFQLHRSPGKLPRSDSRTQFWIVRDHYLCRGFRSLSSQEREALPVRHAVQAAPGHYGGNRGGGGIHIRPDRRGGPCPVDTGHGGHRIPSPWPPSPQPR